jgi:hypothetical protein
MLWRAGHGGLRRGQRRARLLSGSISDEDIQRAALAAVLAEHPALLTFPGLAGALFENPNDFAAGYGLARAVRDLGMSGLLHSNGLFIMPSRGLVHLAHLGVIGCR